MRRGPGKKVSVTQKFGPLGKKETFTFTKRKPRPSNRPATKRVTSVRAGTYQPTRARPKKAEKSMTITTQPRKGFSTGFSASTPSPKRVAVKKVKTTPKGGPSTSTVRFKPSKMKPKTVKQKRKRVKCRTKNGRMSCK